MHLGSNEKEKIGENEVLGFIFFLYFSTQNQFKKLKTESKRNGSNVKKKNKPKIRI